MTLTTAQQQALGRQVFRVLLTEQLTRFTKNGLLPATKPVVDNLTPDKIQDEIVLRQLYCSSITSLETRVLERMRAKLS